jgi:hypothetical protein
VHLLCNCHLKDYFVYLIVIGYNSDHLSVRSAVTSFGSGALVDGRFALNTSLSYAIRCIQEFAVNVTEDFAEYCADGALSVEVWGNRSSGFSAFSGWQIEQMQAKSRSIADRFVFHIIVPNFTL